MGRIAEWVRTYIIIGIVLQPYTPIEAMAVYCKNMCDKIWISSLLGWALITPSCVISKRNGYHESLPLPFYIIDEHKFEKNMTGCIRKHVHLPVVLFYYGWPLSAGIQRLYTQMCISCLVSYFNSMFYAGSYVLCSIKETQNSSVYVLHRIIYW